MNGLCDKLISDNDTENLPQKEIPLYMPKDRTKNYNMSYEGKCFEQYFRIAVTFWNIIKLNVVHKRMPSFGDSISLRFTIMCYSVKSFL